MAKIITYPTMAERLVAFGDLHMNWQAAKVIFGYARDSGIQDAITLGDEGSWSGQYAHEIRPLWNQYRGFRDESPERRLTCIVGDKTPAVPEDLRQNFVGLDAEQHITGSVVYRKDTIIAGHNGQRILDEYGEAIKHHGAYEPLVIFHGHSHSMGVLPEYTWLQPEEIVDYLSNGPQEVNLEPRKVYWVNSGGNFMTNREGRSAANFAVYDSQQQKIILQTIFFTK